MAIEAEGPDGTIHEFPDGTPDDVIDRVMKQAISQSATSAKPEAPEKTDTSLIGAAKRGGEQAANALGAVVSEAGKHIGGGKQFPKLMARVAQYLHDENYKAGSESMLDPNASLMERAGGLGRALVESSPAMVGAVAGPAGIAATSGLLGAGSAIERVRASDNVPADQALNPQQLARVGGSAAIDAAGAFIPAGKALAPGVKGFIPKVGATLEAAASGAKSSAAQTIAQKALLEGQMASPEEMAAAAAVGGVAAGGTRGIRETGKAVGDIPGDRWSRFEGQDPAAMAAAAQRLKEATGGYNKITEANAEDIRRLALAKSKAALKFEAGNKTNGVRDFVKRDTNTLSIEGDPGPAKAYNEAMTSIQMGEPVSKANLETLGALAKARGYDPEWFARLQEASVLGELGNVGMRVGTDGRMGGMHATPIGKSLGWLASKFGVGSVALEGAAHLSGLGGPIGHAGALLGIGSTGLYGALRGIDRLTGYSNPVGTFAKRFDGDPTLYSGPARAIQDTVSGDSSSPPPTTPPGPPTGPSGGPPVVNPLRDKLASVMQGPPNRMQQDNLIGGYMPSMQRPPGMSPDMLVDPLALVRARQAIGQDNAPSPQDNLRQFPAFDGQDNAPLLMQDNNGPTMVPPPGGDGLPTSRVGIPAASNDAEANPIAQALLRRTAPPAPGEEVVDPSIMSQQMSPDYQSQFDTPGAQRLDELFQWGNKSRVERENFGLHEKLRKMFLGQNGEEAPTEAPQPEPTFQDFPQEHGIYDVASPVDQKLLRTNLALQKIKASEEAKAAKAPKEAVQSPKPKAPKKEMKVEGSVTEAPPMEEALKEAPKAQAEPGVEKYSGVFNGVEVAVPTRGIRTTKEQWRAHMDDVAGKRKGFTDSVKDKLPAEHGEALDKLSGDWMHAKYVRRARDKLEAVLKSAKLKDNKIADILSEFDKNGVLLKTWREEE
jgi:hypothetical protein